MLYFFVTLLSLALIYVALTAACIRRRQLPGCTLFAHRGLFDNEHLIPENSLPAFSRAVENGYGIELDVHLTRDERLVVFHDDSLSRVCSCSGDPRQMTLHALQECKLLDTMERIPTLEEVLALVRGQVPLLIELKNCPRPQALVLETLKRLDAYRGEYLIESFSPLVLRQLRRVRPEITRGQLVTPPSGGDSSVSKPTMRALSLLLLNCLSRPNFVAYNQSMDRSFTIFMQRRLFRTPLAAWTVRTQAELDRLKNRASIIIFEGFVPSVSKTLTK